MTYAYNILLRALLLGLASAGLAAGLPVRAAESEATPAPNSSAPAVRPLPPGYPGLGTPAPKWDGPFAFRMEEKRRRIRGCGNAAQAAVARGLRWLAEHQDQDGHWDARRLGADADTDVLVTSFALLAFLAEGENERGGKYGYEVRRAVQWLVARQVRLGAFDAQSFDASPEGLPPPHAVAGLALAESAATAGHSDSANAARNALAATVKFLAERQPGNGDAPPSPPRMDAAGWFVLHATGARRAEILAGTTALKESERLLLQEARARPAVTPAPDLLRKVFQGGPEFHAAVRALNSGDYAARLHAQAALRSLGPEALPALTEALARCDSWEARMRLRRAIAGKTSEAKYRFASPYHAALGLCGLLELDWPAEELEDSVRHLARENGPPRWEPGAPEPDLLAWMLVSQALYQQGGAEWDAWWAGLKDTLARRQDFRSFDAGSWLAGGSQGKALGRAGATALAILCLQTPYRYEKSYR